MSDQEEFPTGTRVLYTNPEDGTLNAPGTVGFYDTYNFYIPLILDEPIVSGPWVFGTEDNPALAVPAELVRA